MKTEALERYLNSFGKYVVQQSRTNLTKGKKNVTKDLYKSISFKVLQLMKVLAFNSIWIAMVLL
jgi:hypothetical protein